VFFQFTVISAEMDIDSQMFMLETNPVLKMLLFKTRKVSGWTKLLKKEKNVANFIRFPPACWNSLASFF
jgi:hypothetical protein